MSLKQKINGLCSELKKVIPRLEQNWGDRVPNMNAKYCACLLLCKCIETTWSAYIRSCDCIHHKSSTIPKRAVNRKLFHVLNT